MALTKFCRRLGSASFPSSDFVFLGCLIALPYTSYVALVGMAGVTVWSLLQGSQAVMSGLTGNGWLLLAGGMVLTAITADYPAESALQLVNFLPFFLFFAAISVFIAHQPKPIAVLESWAFALLLGSIPLSLFAGLEYSLRAPSVVAQLHASPYLAWLYGEIDYGHRASSVFEHPNILSAYLAMIFGLGLGLMLKQLVQPIQQRRTSRHRLFWICGANALALGGIFCSGSRNGVVVAIAQLLVFAWLMRRNRMAAFLGLASITAVFAGVLVWGIGGRTLGTAISTSNLRVEVWKLAVNLIWQNPWLGTGLGGFRLHYVPYSIPEYPIVEHAHNLWLMLSAEIGIPLMLLFSILVGKVCYEGVKSFITQPFNQAEKPILVGYLLSFLGCTLFALFDITFYDARVNVLGWLTLAAIQAIPFLPRQANPSSLD